MPLRRLSIEETSQAMGMLLTGASLRTVAAHLNVSHNVIRRVRMDLRATGSVQHRHGEIRSTTVRDDRFIKFSCNATDGGVKVLRNRGERYIENHVTYHQAYGGGSITVWGSISATRRTELVMLGNATMNSVRYLNEVLQPVVLPFVNEIGDGLHTERMGLPEQVDKVMGSGSKQLPSALNYRLGRIAKYSLALYSGFDFQHAKTLPRNHKS